ncbi:TraR/DksA family transcriptional regulator [Aquabacterium sp. OR-4]|uniref:TraR/DksA family transcriptional regulator n=1 Tax=Aquabacterium sp. OR-4 TaxID=2978127 RepID=UPI0021B17A1C|nr:TraR/DksA C4-type zinc finger protein [Aquabacterium sp. OR-4]MDT7834008.1 TraR/DksA C4-type zinc finger protein [Aquabacterium sp. OR-4]
MNKHLSSQDRAALQVALAMRREQLETQRHQHLAGQTRAEHAREVLLQDGDDAPQRDADRELDLAIADREVLGLAAIDAALQRLSSGHYGLCADCEAAIPLARLQLEPQALRCVACESRRERGQPRPASL